MGQIKKRLLTIILLLILFIFILFIIIPILVLILLSEEEYGNATYISSLMERETTRKIKVGIKKIKPSVTRISSVTEREETKIELRPIIPTTTGKQTTKTIPEIPLPAWIPPEKELIQMKFRNECLEAHNLYRRKHGTPPLKHSEKLEDYAVKWAERLAKESKLYHSPAKPQNYGENLYMGAMPEITCTEIISMWYNEVSKYDFNKNIKVASVLTGHFTQIVWKGSTELGCGFSASPLGLVYAVCNYIPKGNEGDFKNNVLEPIS